MKRLTPVQRRKREAQMIDTGTEAGAANLLSGLSGWPEHPERVREEDREVIQALARSPDYDRFPDLHDHFDGGTVEAIRRARRPHQEGEQA